MRALPHHIMPPPPPPPPPPAPCRLPPASASSECFRPAILIGSSAQSLLQAVRAPSAAAEIAALLERRAQERKRRVVSIRDRQLECFNLLNRRRLISKSDDAHAQLTV